MKKIILTLLVLTALFAIVKYTVNTGPGGLVGPTIQQIIQSKPNPTPPPTMVSPNAPKTFNFDSITDLKMELNKVNPQVLDSDFE